MISSESIICLQDYLNNLARTAKLAEMLGAGSQDASNNRNRYGPLRFSLGIAKNGKSLFMSASVLADCSQLSKIYGDFTCYSIKEAYYLGRSCVRNWYRS